jgi:hypothetical protein
MSARPGTEGPDVRINPGDRIREPEFRTKPRAFPFRGAKREEGVWLTRIGCDVAVEILGASEIDYMIVPWKDPR